MPFKAKSKKSGDAKLSDATAAREVERTAKISAADAPQHLISEVEDAAEQKRAAGDKEGADRAEKALTLLTTALAAMEKRVMAMEARPQGSASTRLEDPTPRLRCSTCGQVIKNAAGRGVCGGEHVYTMVAPQGMDMWNSFPGVEWNGVKYVGRHMLPPEVADSVRAQIGRWEHTEKKKFINSGRIFGEVGDVSSLAVGRTAII